MNREIKFRAWNGEAMEYGGFSIHATGEVFEISPLSNVKKDSPLMQFTGLKDKNGKEIYEGDILKSESKEHPFIFDVVFRDGSYYMGQWPTYLCEFNLKTLKYEVIGIIFENPNLLEK